MTPTRGAVELDDMTAVFAVVAGGTALALAGYGVWWVLSAFTARDAAAVVTAAAGLAVMVVGLAGARGME